MKVIATKKVVENYFKALKAEDLTDEFVYSRDSFREPFYFASPEGLGMTMPDPSTTIDDIARIVGRTTPVEVIDVASQTGLAHWTMGQWADYYVSSWRLVYQ